MRRATFIRHVVSACMALVAYVCTAAAQPADYPGRTEGTYIARDFRFSNGDTLPEVKLHYTTLGDRKNPAVLVLHGTAGSGTGMINPGFAGELFGPGQPLDASRYYIILPDALGAGKSSKPSDGLKAKFPRYSYDDMVAAQHKVVTEGLGIKHLRLVIGNSMGGMHTWMWGAKYPTMMDALVPMASQPTEMSSRNWIMRRMISDLIRNDPEWKGGDYTAQPKSARIANVYYGFATNGGTLALQKAAPTRAAADKLLDDRLAAAFAADANNFLYQWESSRDYNPEPLLEKIEAPLLAINSADDERNPPETGLLEQALKKVKKGRLLLIPASDATRGHGTTALAKFWTKDLEALLASAPKRAE